MSEERKDDESGESDSSNRSGDEVLRDLGIPMQTMVYRPMAEERSTLILSLLSSPLW